MIKSISSFFEKKTFGVCAWWGKKMGIRTPKVRLFFIYLSFIAFGSPLIIYLAMVFILEHKEMFKVKRRRSTIWEL